MDLDVAALNRCLPEQAPWQLLGHLPGGSQSAALVADVDGIRFVAKQHLGAELQYFTAVQARVEVARRTGLPAPRTQAIETPGAVLLLLEELPGQAGLSPTPQVALELIAFSDQLAGLGDPRDTGAWRSVMRDSLTEGLTGYCQHASLKQHSHASSTLLTRITTAATGIDWEGLPADDLVHYDFHPGNVLVLDDHVSGIVDWDGSRTGDQLLDLASLAFSTSFAGRAEVVAQLWRAFFARGDEQRRSVALHHIVLRLADWCIRYSPRDHADLVIATGHRALDSLDAGHW